MKVDVQKHDIRIFRSLVSGGFSFQGNFDRPNHFRRPILSEYFIDKVVEISEILKAKRINGERERERELRKGPWGVRGLYLEQTPLLMVIRSLKLPSFYNQAQ